MKRVTRFLMFLCFVVVVLAGFIFTVKNPLEASLWLGTEFQPRPLGVWIIAAFISGGLLGLLVGFGMWGKLRTRVQVMQLQNKLQQSQKELALLQKQLKPAENPLHH